MTVKLKAEDLRRFCHVSEIPFKTTDEIEPYLGIVGQQRAEKSLEFGLRIKNKGYNIYVSGQPGTGKMSFAKAFARNCAKSMPVPDDLCYIYNFKDPKRPKLLRLKAGQGTVFKQELEDFISMLLVEIPKEMQSKEFEDEKHGIVGCYKEKCDLLIADVTKEAKDRGFGVKLTSTGIYFMPVINSEMISEEQYEELSEEEKSVISQKSDIIQEKAAEVMSKVKEQEKITKDDVENLEYRTALFVVGRHITPLMEKYEDNEGVTEYLNLLKEDILENYVDFIGDDNQEEESLSALVPWIAKKNGDDFLSKYKVNALTDNSKLDGAPVIVEYNPTYANLTGEVEYDNEYGSFTTDFMKIKAGVLHRANGGFLILNANDVLSGHLVWEVIKKCIKTKEIVIEPLREHMTGVAMSGIKPEPCPLSIKIILVGSSYLHDILYEYDDDFPKLFKINSIFDYEMEYSNKNVVEICGFIKRFIDKSKILPFDSGAVCKILEYSTRISESKNKLTAQLNKIADIMIEADVWANMDNAESVSDRHVRKAIDEKISRVNIYEDKLTEMIEQNTIMIATVGRKIGQINGLAVIDAFDYIFAKPSRITATTYMGKSGIVNIEKEAKMSGSIHEKGVQVLSGYLGQKYAQEFPLSLSCRICFEQNYSGIDGDSASSTELYAILSSLSEAPINQEIAVTGSINQRGEIQPIGGVTYKIEGFFDLCEKRGLTGNQGVIIPIQNVADLALKDSVVEAVEKDAFHIYAIEHVDEGIEILTGVKAGEMNEKGKYPPSSIHGRALKKLKEFYKNSLEKQ